MLSQASTYGSFASLQLAPQIKLPPLINYQLLARHLDCHAPLKWLQQLESELTLVTSDLKSARGQKALKSQNARGSKRSLERSEAL